MAALKSCADSRKCRVIMLSGLREAGGPGRRLEKGREQFGNAAGVHACSFIFQFSRCMPAWAATGSELIG